MNEKGASVPQSGAEALMCLCLFLFLLFDCSLCSIDSVDDFFSFN